MHTSYLRRAIEWLTYAIVFATPLLFFRYSMFPFNIPKVFFFEALVEIMLGLWLGLLILDWPHKRYLPKLNVLNWAILIFSGSLLISALTGVDLARSLWSTNDRVFGVIGILHVLAFIFIVPTVIKDWRKLLKISFASASIVAVSVFFSKWGLYSFFLKQNATRPGGTLGNSAFTGAYLLFNIFTGSWLWKEARAIRIKLWVGIGIVLQILAIFLGQTIGIILGLVAGLVFLFVWLALREGGKMRALAIYLVLAFVVFGGILFLTRDSSFWQKVPGLARVATISTSQSDVKDRLLAWRIALEAFKDRPLLGWGFENFNIPFNSHYDPHLLAVSFQGSVFDKPHNVFLEYLVAGGILGLLAYLALFGAWFKELSRAGKKDVALYSAAPYLAAGIVAYLVQDSIAFDTIATYLMLSIFFVAVQIAARGEAESAPVSGFVASPAKQMAAAICLAGSLALVGFYPVATQAMFYNYYNAVNYFLNGLLESSNLSWQSALAARTPYEDYVRKDFADTLEQGFAQNVVYPHIDDLVKQGASGLELAATHHPRDYFFHISLADYYVALSPFGKDAYLSRAKEEINKSIELSPTRQQPYYVLARERLYESDPQGAVAALEKAIDLNPESGDPHFTYGLLEYGLSQSATSTLAANADIKTADREIRLAHDLGRDPMTPDEAIKLAGFVGDLKGDYHASAEYLRSGLEIAMHLGDTHTIQNVRLKLGVACYLSGENSCAKEQFEVLAKELDLKQLPIWRDLKPALDELGVQY